VSGCGETIIVVYHDKQFEFLKGDAGTKREAIEHGKRQGIPEGELDFPTD
jgi:hypothetical protein